MNIVENILRNVGFNKKSVKVEEIKVSVPNEIGIQVFSLALDKQGNSVLIVIV